ncbi:hypothetical protein [Crocosphaera sp. XPORK-15E]|nr:hypothetical protein [Crocosphaera sp. XPORK-15E]MEA5536580.1 hypothetical protein [Crocosphaera sp. XPORK-15E]
MMDLNKEKRVTFNGVAWVLIMIGLCQINPLMALGFLCSFWVIFY